MHRADARLAQPFDIIRVIRVADILANASASRAGSCSEDAKLSTTAAQASSKAVRTTFNTSGPKEAPSIIRRARMTLPCHFPSGGKIGKDKRPFRVVRAIDHGIERGLRTPPAIARRMTAPSVATAMDARLRPSSYRKPSMLEIMNPPIRAPMTPTMRFVSRPWFRPMMRSASHPEMMPTTMQAIMLVLRP